MSGGRLSFTVFSECSGLGPEGQIASPNFHQRTQGRFKICVAMAPLLRHTLIAILAKEGRWLVIFKYAAALLVLEENHPQRCVESSGELMTGHLSGSEWIANLIEQGVAFAAHNLEVGAVVDRCH